MQNKTSMKYALGSLLAAVALAVCALPAQAKPGTAVVKAVTGTASYNGADGLVHPLTVGTALKQGDTVTTGKDSSVDLFLDRNGPGVGLGANSILRLERLSYEESRLGPVISTRLDLKQGEIYGTVKKLIGRSKFEVMTPKGLADVRGTEFYIDAFSGNIYVVSGTVTVTITWEVERGATQTRTVTVSAGQMICLSTQYTSITQIVAQPIPRSLTPALLRLMAQLRLLTGYNKPSSKSGTVNEIFDVKKQGKGYNVDRPPDRIIVSP